MAYSTISKPSLHFNTLTYTGDIQDSDGSGHTQSITGLGFQPDLSWVKNRSAANGHIFQDSVRTTASNYNWLNTASTHEEKTANENGAIKSFDSDGITLEAGTYSSSKAVNVAGNGSNYCAWNWKANGAGSSNSDGSTTTTVSANTTAGFSIVSWTGTGSATTLGHGLGATPQVILVKNRSEVYGWQMYHPGLGGNNKYISINSTDAVATDTTSWNNTAPTSSVFSVGASDANNKSGNNIIAYCFAEKKGYSKFGSYTGNGNANGAFIYTGFKPALVIIKRTDSSSGANWLLLDSVRSDINIVNENLFANLNDAETSTERCDFLSNGLKLRQTGTTVNGSGASYIFMAFAAEPLVANVGASIPATAR